MGGTAAWMSTKTGRAPMRSRGRPPPRLEVERASWVKVAEGLSSEDAAVVVGVSGPGGSRWFRQRGGMPAALRRGPSSGRYLSFRRAGGYRAATCPGHRRARGRPPDRAGSVNGLAGAAAQRGHPGRSAAVPGVGRAVEGRAGCPPFQVRHAGGERSAARLRRRPAVRAGPPPGWHAGAVSGHGGMEGAEQATTSRSALGDGMEPGADRSPATGGLPS